MVKKVKELILYPENITSDNEAYLLAMLFLATRKGIYRKTVKEYVNANDTVMPALRALMPILKEIKTR